jgi:hypothetical protein
MKTKRDITEPDSGYSRLESQISWYDKKCGRAQDYYKGAKVFEIICAAAIPLIARDYPQITAILGAIIVSLEALQHLNQWQHNWITYRSTCEALRHEKYTYLARSGPYNLDDQNALKALVERVEGLISTEHSKWISNQERIANPKK